MSRRVVISGLGPVSGLGVGVEPMWQAVLEGRGAIGPIQAFDASAFDCRIAAEVRDFKVSNYVPKSYRKAVKVMARDIELAVAAADQAARDAGLITKGTLGADAADPSALSYPPSRVGAQIGAGLIAADINELTTALVEARDEQGKFSLHRWGREGINHLTPLWLLKYLPNMLACHVTIIHDAQGPSNTITCTEASSGLSIGEALHIIQRGGADASFCGGAESKLNPLIYMRHQMAGVLNTTDNDRPRQAVRPFCKTAAGTVAGEGGAIVILECLDTWRTRRRDQGRPQPYAEVAGFAASQTVHLESRNSRPDPAGRSIAAAIRAAMAEARIGPEDIDLIVPYGSAIPAWDQAEAAALRSTLGPHAARIPLVSPIPLLGNCGAGAGGLGVCLAAKALAEQTIPPTINCDQPLDGLAAPTATSRQAPLRHVLTFTAGTGGQNAALVLRRFEN